MEEYERNWGSPEGESLSPSLDFSACVTELIVNFFLGLLNKP